MGYEDQIRDQNKWIDSLEEQICQNIEERLLYRQKMQMMEQQIKDKNKNLKAVMNRLDVKKIQISQVMNEIKSKNNEVAANYVTFHNSSQSNHLKKSSQISEQESEEDEKQTLITSSVSPKKMRTDNNNLMTAKKGVNSVYINDFQSTNQKMITDSVSSSSNNNQVQKSQYSQQYSSQKTKIAYESSNQIKQFDTCLTQSDSKPPKQSQFNKEQNNPSAAINHSRISSNGIMNGNQQELNKSQYSTENQNEQRITNESHQYETLRRYSPLQNNNQYQSNHFSNFTIGPHLQDSVLTKKEDLNAAQQQFNEQENDHHKIKFTVSTLQSQNICQSVNSNNSAQEKSENIQSKLWEIKQYESQIQQNEQDMAPYYDLNNKTDQKKFIIKPLPLENSVSDFNDQTEFVLTESNLVSDKRQALADKSFDQLPSNRLYIQQLNEILNSMQNQNDLSKKPVTSVKKQPLNAQSTIYESTSSYKSSSVIKQPDYEQQLQNILKESNQLEGTTTQSKLSSSINPLNKSQTLMNSSKREQEALKRSQLKSYLEESMISQIQEENSEATATPQKQMFEKNQQTASGKKNSDLSPKENLIKSIKKMEKIEKKLTKNDPLLFELYSLIQQKNN